MSYSAETSSSDPTPASSETAPSDAAPSDAAPSDTASSDAAPSYTAPSDTAPSDAAPSDAAPSYTAPSDASPSDASPLDAAPLDAAPSSGDEWFRLAQACDRILSGNRPISMRERLTALARVDLPDVDLDVRADMYGDGPVTVLEQRVAELLGKPAAVFFPTGTMAQQIALRCWADRTGQRVVAMHPQSHLEVHERKAFSTLSNLRSVWPTAEARPPTADDVRAADEPFGTLLLELPQRDSGFLLPTLAGLAATVDAARERGARVHFDGARLWETTHHFGQSLATIASLADSVYVSFYKTMGGISGAALAGDADFVATARAWRHRYGGNLFQQWPAALSALVGIEAELPRLPSYVEHAATVADVLSKLPGSVVNPSPPHTHQFQLWLPYPAEALNNAGHRLAEEEKIWFAGRWVDQPPTPYAMCEMTIASPALAFTASDVASAAEAFLARIRVA